SRDWSSDLCSSDLSESHQSHRCGKRFSSRRPSWLDRREAACLEQQSPCLLHRMNLCPVFVLYREVGISKSDITGKLQVIPRQSPGDRHVGGERDVPLKCHAVEGDRVVEGRGTVERCGPNILEIVAIHVQVAFYT